MVRAVIIDGTEFNSYVVRKNPKSDIPPRKVISIVEDRRNSLWVRTSDNRLYRFDKTTETFNDMYSELRKVASNLKVIKSRLSTTGTPLSIPATRIYMKSAWTRTTVRISERFTMRATT